MCDAEADFQHVKRTERALFRHRPVCQAASAKADISFPSVLRLCTGPCGSALHSQVLSWSTRIPSTAGSIVDKDPFHCQLYRRQRSLPLPTLSSDRAWHPLFLSTHHSPTGPHISKAFPIVVLVRTSLAPSAGADQLAPAHDLGR